MNTPNANICRHGIWHLAVLCAVQLLLTGVGGAQTTTWNNPGTGSWFIPGNWSNGVPTFNTDFLIRNGGTAQVLGGGFANSSSPYLGISAGESGNLVVSDSGSTWNYAYSFFVGEAGTGKLSIQGGGVVSGNPGYNAFIGGVPGNGTGNGTVLVDGIGSTWTHHGLIYVGADGTGELTIQNGGVVSESDPFTNTYIGYAASSRGTALVSGAGSIWNNSGGLVVGYQGTGLLTIRDGATVSSAGATIGFDGGSLGTVLVEGNGSTWNCAHQLSIASYGTGRLTIQDGGTVNVNGGTGTVELTTIPPGTGTLDIGAFGGGTRAGTLHAAIVNGGLGTAVVNFNQTDTITFAPRITGSTSVNQLGSGATILSGTHTYTGATTATSPTSTSTPRTPISHFP